MAKFDRKLSARDKQKLEQFRLALAPVQTSMSLPMVVTLLTLAIEPGLSVNELADRTKTTQQTASRYISILMGRYDTDLFASTNMQPLVAQEINADDPRKRALFLTEAGWQFVASLFEAPETTRSAS